VSPFTFCGYKSYHEVVLVLLASEVLLSAHRAIDFEDATIDAFSYLEDVTKELTIQQWHIRDYVVFGKSSPFLPGDRLRLLHWYHLN
jgi:hypothetical protein